MRNFTLFFLLISSFCFAQMPNISSVWLNKHQVYNGTIGPEKTALKLKIDLSSQDKKNDQEYFVSGYSIVENNKSNFEGKLKITLYKDGKKSGKVFGEYELLEEPKDKHSGVFKGKFIYTFKWNKKTQKVESPYMQFVGTWQNYQKNLNYQTNWNNN